MDKSKIKIAFLSTYPPRECGIATFTKSFQRTLDQLYVANQTKLIAVSDVAGKYKYSERVIFDIDQFDKRSYVDAANFINLSSIEIVSIQHEYGIYGGEDGRYIIKFMETLNKPIVMHLHSVLRHHGEHRHKLTQRMLDLADAVVVMTKNAKKILTEVFKIDPDKIKIIPHGVPNVRFDKKNAGKDKFGFKGRTVLSTFGLINRGKGIEIAIRAMSEVVKKHPEAVYLIIGATHPVILEREGESYRKELEDLVKKHGLEDNVKFVNQYLDYRELVDYLKITDIYLAPQLDFNQAFSGTLSYALGCGCASISSPTNFAQEALANGRGIIANPEEGEIAEKIIKLLDHPAVMNKMQLEAYLFARDMIWPDVSLKFLKLLEKQIYLNREKWWKRIPDFSERPSLKYIQRMTDEFGIVQHALFSEPDYNFGYSLDDQARALIVSTKYINDHPEAYQDQEKYIKIYLDYLRKAIDEKGIIHNFIDLNKKYVDKEASDDSVARSFWALAYLVGSKIPDDKIMGEAKELLKVYEKNLKFNFVKTVSYILLGYYYLKNKKQVMAQSDKIVEWYKKESQDNWRWFESSLTWGNGIVPYALIKAFEYTGEKNYFKVAMDSIKFLETVCYCERQETILRKKNIIPVPIGQNGWFFRDKRRALYDQQPIEAGDMTILYNELFKITKEEKYRKKATEWMGWYFGNNINKVNLYDCYTRGVYDGVTKKGVNLNQGAESIVVYLLAYLSFRGGL